VDRHESAGPDSAETEIEARIDPARRQIGLAIRKKPSQQVRHRETAQPKVATGQPAKSPSPKRPVFTNCGKAGQPEKPAKPVQKKLKRVPFEVSRLLEFCTKRELVNVTGHDISEWPLVVVKETVDNALDAAEEAEIAPVIEVVVKGRKIIVEDNAGGIPATTIEGILDYSKRVSSREAYVSPSRGAQGNAISSILPMSYVLDARRKENARGKTIIESHGVAHHITFDVDHIKQQPKITHTKKPSSMVRGARITVELPAYQHSFFGERDFIAERKDELLELAEAFVWLNPHLTMRASWGGAVKIDAKASNPTWKKWSPSWPTSAHWYDASRFRRYMAAHIANRADITVREFIGELRGMSSTAKQKQVLAETGASHVSLHRFFGLRKANTENIAKLLAAIQKHTKTVRPAELGIIGKAHLFARMEEAGGDPRTFKYERRLGETNGVPRVIEFAFGIHRDGLGAGRGPSRKEVTGVNWSAAIDNPFHHLGRSGEGLDAILHGVRANTSQPVIVVLHLACPRVAYTDRGKTAIVVEGEVDDVEEDC
jgi:hypothetical protein